MPIIPILLVSTIARSQVLRHSDMISALKKTEPKVAALVKIKPMTWPKGEDRPATRQEIVVLFDQMFQHYQPAFKFTPRPYRVVEKAIKTNEDPKLQARLKKLSRWGCIGPVGPLVVGPEHISNKQFGDSLGYFYSQILYLANQPDPRWTPELKGIFDGE